MNQIKVWNTDAYMSHANMLNLLVPGRNNISIRVVGFVNSYGYTDIIYTIYVFKVYKKNEHVSG